MGPGRQLTQPSAGVKAIQTRHDHIEQNQIERMPGKGKQREFAAAHLFDVEALRRQRVVDDHAGEGIVVDHQNSN